MNQLLVFDYKLFLVFNGWAGKSSIFDSVVILFAHYGVYFVAFGLIVWWFVARDPWSVRKRLMLAFISFISARFIVTEIIRAFLPRQRPFLTHNVVQLIAKDKEQSFPSGHAAAMFAIATSLYFYNKRLGWWFAVLAVLISLSRVIAGVHYPTDIVGGAVVGILSAWVIEKLLNAKIGNITPKISAFTDKLLPFKKR